MASHSLRISDFSHFKAKEMHLVEKSETKGWIKIFPINAFAIYMKDLPSTLPQLFQERNHGAHLTGGLGAIVCPGAFDCLGTVFIPQSTKINTSVTQFIQN